MAIISIPSSATLEVKLQTGLNAAGNPVYKTLHFNNVKPIAVDADLHAVGQALGALQSHAVAGLYRTNIGELINQ